MSDETRRSKAAAEADELRRLLPHTGPFEHREWTDACRASSVDGLASFLAIASAPWGAHSEAKRDAARIIAGAKIAEGLAQRIESLEAIATKLEKRALLVAVVGVIVAIVGVALTAAQVLGWT